MIRKNGWKHNNKNLFTELIKKLIKLPFTVEIKLKQNVSSLHLEPLQVFGFVQIDFLYLKYQKNW